jgi:hypothetical protein
LGLFLPEHPGTGKSQTITFDLTPSIRALRDKNTWNENDMTISFVPVGLISGRNREQLPSQPSVRLTIQRVSISAR